MADGWPVLRCPWCSYALAGYELGRADAMLAHIERDHDRSWDDFERERRAANPDAFRRHRLRPVRTEESRNG